MNSQFLCKAKVFDSDQEIQGGIFEFYNKVTQQKVTLMIHENKNGQPTVTRIDPLTIQGTFDCWTWLMDWIKAYELSTGKINFEEFKSWIDNQPMVERDTYEKS